MIPSAQPAKFHENTLNLHHVLTGFPPITPRDPLSIITHMFPHISICHFLKLQIRPNPGVKQQPTSVLRCAMTA